MWDAETAKKVLMDKRNHMSAFYCSQSYNFDPFGEVFCSREEVSWPLEAEGVIGPTTSKAHIEKGQGETTDCKYAAGA